jgi:hypothetical protein
MSEEVTPEDAPAPAPPPSVTLDGDISHLATIAIQLHEMYLELKKSGFKPKEALDLTGMVLTSFITPEYTFIEDESEFDEQEDNALDFPEDEYPEE